MIYFVGAGPGAVDLITVRGQKLLARADLLVYAGSLVHPALTELCPPHCEIHDSAFLNLEETTALLLSRPSSETVVRLHTGDPSLYGAIREQMERLDSLGVDYEQVPGVSSFAAAAAALRVEYTQPELSQTVIISRMEGRTPVPEKEKIRLLAAHGSSMVLFLSAGMLTELCRELILGGYPATTPAALVYKASWPEEERVMATLADLPEKAAHIHNHALILVGDFLSSHGRRSRLYHPEFSHGFREGRS